MTQKTDQDVMRENNKKLVLKTLFNAGPTSRSAIASSIHLQKSTVSSIVRELHELGLIEELGIGESSNVGGRKPNLIQFNYHYGYVLAFDMGARHLRYSVNYLNGEVIQKESLRLIGKSIKDVFQMMKKIIGLLPTFDTKKGLLGIAVSTHAPVYDNKIRYSPFLELDSFSLLDALQEVVKVPIRFENEANLTAISIRDFWNHADAEPLNNLIALNIHNGIGVGTIINEQLYHGVEGLAGEIGRSVIWKDKQVYRLEELYSEKAIIEKVAKHEKKADLTVDEFVALIKTGNEYVLAVVDEWISAISQITYNLVQYSAPDAIFLSSRSLSQFPELLERISVKYKELNPLGETQIKFTEHDIYDSSLLGGVALITRQVLGLESQKIIFKK
ncbi:ROK family transcriptional regulator [Listeria ivanovii]|uniref:Sugar kinase of the NBD/HSP70 family, may contain an N-terminal HTH domain n=1 Tax=Listeria ivanovii TaxID=1638 RepID=A0AAX2DQZ5_LISIV|nr:ROK family transcriptional regulator [Listeria ivanovii]EFR97963.1 xylose repressor [Listeria ivanovii FSL F6-596]AIS61778.1 transcriptional regulator [Listeria ivanovii subsp. londoniensis]MBC2254628.1 ROK family protein [Listeria ivanovii]MBK1965776.1 ROK family transcriptional regulator [Listeria ivanovii subsp. londoniensis]MBK1984877.1 ROK family transcriptional regulator [Listeria ivanovii subsp. londoniensis]